MIRVAILDGPVPGLPSEVGAFPNLLHPRERSVLSPRAVAKRRDDFLRGRYTARSLLARALSLETEALAVIPDHEGVPWAEHDTLGRLPVSLSLSHTHEVAAAAIVDLPFRVGIDVEQPIASPDSIVADYFERCEAALCDLEGSERSVRAATIWALKEAGLKSLGTGLRLPTSAIVVRAIDDQLDASGWSRVEMELGSTAPEPHDALRGWIRRHQEVMVALCVRLTALGGEVEPPPPWLFRTR